MKIPVDDVELEAELRLAEEKDKLVIFAHGSGSSRKSPRNNFVADIIRKRKIGTLLFDLLTEKEDRTYANRFDIPLLTSRLVGVTDWVFKRKGLETLKIGYFGASTGAASAINAAVNRSQRAQAVVSRGGRVDMAKNNLSLVKAATLFIVGGNDTQVLQMNRQAFDLLTCEHKKLEIVPGAGHLFSGPGELEKVAKLAAEWFEKFL